VTNCVCVCARARERERERERESALGIELKALNMLSTHSTAGLHPPDPKFCSDMDYLKCSDMD
jgi:hypothetical protein